MEVGGGGRWVECRVYQEQSQIPSPDVTYLVEAETPLVVRHVGCSTDLHYEPLSTATNGYQLEFRLLI